MLKCTFEIIKQAMHPTTHEELDKQFTDYDNTALVLFENVLPDSGGYGRRAVLPIGQKNMFKTLDDCKNSWLGDKGNYLVPIVFCDVVKPKPVVDKLQG